MTVEQPGSFGAFPSMTLREEHRDPGFQRRIDELKRAEELGGRNGAWQALLLMPWVTDGLFNPQHPSHCPHGHVGPHEIGDPPESQQGRECRRRRCLRCSSTWFEPTS